MTETPSRQKPPLDDQIRQYIADRGNLKDDQVITGAVLVVETEETLHGMTVTGRHRFYPLGAINPHNECGLLRKAATDAENS